ncbi:MAG TPA: molybdopterin-dependent oxidoreductase, partial [Candidatus Nanoarchaeia archaeon]|nr:molybdopterin-dependent oxidoreductase [Candidatus Nanoarchaeia archaeon]
MDKESSCIYCGCACRLKYEVTDNNITKVGAVKTDDVSEGAPCIKGLTIHEAYNKNKIETPLINGKKATIKQALDYIYKNTKELAPSEVFFNISGKITNENNYLIQKFANTFYNTSNVDSCCGRLCHNATVQGMKNVYGTPNLTVMNDVKLIDTILIIGSEPDKSYPVFYNKLIRNKTKIIRVHSFIKGCSKLECVITIKPGSETCLLNGLINELIRKKYKSSIDGFELLKKTVSSYNNSFVCRITGLDKKDYKNLITQIHKSKRLGVFHGMGLTQHLNSLENIHSLLNLVLLTNARIFSLRGEINVQGAGDISVTDLNSNPQKGLNIIEALMLSPVKAAFITEFNPLKSMPDTEQLKNKLKKTFITYFGSHKNEMSKRANVVIPIPSMLGCEGTITNGERRIRKVNRVINEGVELWQVLSELSKRFKKSKKLNYKNTKEIFNELKKTITDYNQVNTETIWQGTDAWTSKAINHERFMPEQFDGLDQSTSAKYPFLLTTYRSKASFLGDEITGNSETLKGMREKSGFYLN